MSNFKFQLNLSMHVGENAENAWTESQTDIEL